VLDAAIAGLLTGLSLIVAIGAQNAYVLRQGLVREHVGVVVAICSVSDLVLIAAGVGGVGAVVRSAPTALTIVRWLGVAFLTAYGVRSFWRAAHDSGSLTAARDDEPSLRGAVLQATALTWLNPHVYLDTVLLLGSIAAHHGPTGKWWFAAGACCGSILWFTSLGYGARLLAPLLSRPRAWQVLDVLIGVVMLTIAVQLARG
jgi:L-lysine exporter family protein LysE/ArgO